MITVQAHGNTYEFMPRAAHQKRRRAARSDETLLRLQDPLRARAFLRRILSAGPIGLHRILALVDPFAQVRSEADVVECVTRWLVCGSVLVLERRARVPVGLVLRDKTETPASTASTRTWVEVEIVDDSTGEPVPNAKVAITAPGVEQRDATTSAGGIVSVKPCGEGTAKLIATYRGAFVGDTLEVLGEGEASMTPLRGQPLARTPGKPWALARIVRHRVRTGESLDSIAKANGMTWHELAKFNFGSDDPKKVNLGLRDQIGCTRRTKSDKNYVLDSSDEPGILFIPQPAVVTGLTTGEQHVVRARAVDRPMQFFLFSH